MACPLKGLVGLACCTLNCNSSNYNICQKRELATKICGSPPVNPLFGISMSQPTVHYAKMTNIQNKVDAVLQ